MVKQRMADADVGVAGILAGIAERRLLNAV